MASIADRYNISDRVAAAIATATLVDFGLVSPDNRLHVIDKNKIRRERESYRDALVKNLSFDGIQGLYFDGRGDTAIAYENRAITKEKQEHISFVQQPHSYYIGHKTVLGKKADITADYIDDFVEEKGIPNVKIKAIGYLFGNIERTK